MAGSPSERPVRVTVCWPASSLMTKSVGLLSVGRSFTGVTWTRKVTTRVSLPPPRTPPSSFSVMVISTSPFLFATGVNVSVPAAAGFT